MTPDIELVLKAAKESGLLLFYQKLQNLIKERDEKQEKLEKDFTNNNWP